MHEAERRALGEFLRSRRARLAPEDVGLPRGARRRAAGLRREEVATLAGVSVTWYTWIEQGREIAASAAVLASIARVLRLSPEEQRYLFTLAEQPAPRATAAAGGAVSQTLQRILDHQGDYPAYLMGRLWAIVAWNRAAQRLFGDFAAMPEPERNMLWYTFAHPPARSLVVGWEPRAKRLLAEFRAECGHLLNDPACHALVARVAAASPEFASWWRQHDVQTRDGGQREFQHPEVGRLALIQTTLLVSGAPELKLVIHLPLPDGDGAAQLRQLSGAP